MGEIGGVDELFTLMLDELHHLPADHAAAVESLVRNRLLQSSIAGRCRWDGDSRYLTHSSLVAGGREERDGHRDSGTDGAELSNPTAEVGGVDELFTLMLD